MAIKIENLCKSYKNNLVLNKLNLNIKEGSLFGLLGANGAGKTTLISILNSLEKKDSGNIEIYGKNIDTKANEIKNLCSYVPQNYAFYPKLTAYENLEYFGALYGLEAKQLKQKINYSLKINSLEKYKNKKANTYSGGLKRRLNIAIGLLNNPKILYLDEPTVGIDPQSRKHILNIIKQINKTKNTTIIYTSHYMEEVEFLCDEIAILDKSKIILQEKKETLLQKNSMLICELLNGEKKQIDIKNNYNEFTNFILDISKKKRQIKNINFSHKSLEELFFSLTKQELRD